MRHPSQAMIGAITSHLRAMGLDDAAGQASVIARLSLELAEPRLRDEVALAWRTADFVREQQRREAGELTALRYIAVQYASGLADGGAFARVTLQGLRRSR